MSKESKINRIKELDAEAKKLKEQGREIEGNEEKMEMLKAKWEKVISECPYCESCETQRISVIPYLEYSCKSCKSTFWGGVSEE